MAGALGRDHDDIHVRRRDDLPEVDVEAVREAERHAAAQVRGHLVGVDLCHLLVVYEQHDEIGPFHRVLRVQHLDPVLARPHGALRVLVEADNHRDAAVPEV